MEKYQKEVDGQTVVKEQNEIVIKKDGRVTYNPTEAMILDDGWVAFDEPAIAEPQDPTELPISVQLRRAKNVKLRDLEMYDSSKEVNDCVIVYQGNELHYWASKDERNDLKNAVRDCISVGREVYRLDLRDKGLSIELQCELLLQMMAALEVYAIDCYNKTTDHEFAIKALETLEEVEAYDFKVGYPEKLRFEV